MRPTAADGSGASPMPSRIAGCRTVSGMNCGGIEPPPPRARHRPQASPRKRTRPSWWTAVTGPRPWPTGSAKLKLSSASSAARIDSARAGTSYMGIGTPYWTSVAGSWRTWLGSYTTCILVPFLGLARRAARPYDRTGPYKPGQGGLSHQGGWDGGYDGSSYRRPGTVRPAVVRPGPRGQRPERPFLQHRGLHRHHGGVGAVVLYPGLPADREGRVLHQLWPDGHPRRGLLCLPGPYLRLAGDRDAAVRGRLRLH